MPPKKPATLVLYGRGRDPSLRSGHLHSERSEESLPRFRVMAKLGTLLFRASLISTAEVEVLHFVQDAWRLFSPQDLLVLSRGFNPASSLPWQPDLYGRGRGPSLALRTHANRYQPLYCQLPTVNYPLPPLQSPPSAGQPMHARHLWTRSNPHP
jgi:hypothetical protein